MSALLDLVSPNAVHGMGAVAGLAGGLIATRLVDALPRRYDITLLVTGAPRTKRNVAVVALSIAIGVGLAHFVTMAAGVSIGLAAFYFGVNLTLALLLVTAAAIDLEHMILPNELTLGGSVLAVASAEWRAIGLRGSLLGLAVGLAITYVPFLIYKRLRGRSGMGLGDAKLAVFAGAWLGAPGAIFVVFAGAIQSALCAAIMRVLGLSFAVPASVEAEIAELRAQAAAGDEEARAALSDDPMAADVDSSAPSLGRMRLPMGPFLVLGCLEFLFARRQILELFDRYLSPP
jgi:leader peptidase (prepilin peptidase)/N-methyltransferase